MYTIAKNVQIVIACLKAHGLNQIVLSPGGTNAPFIRGIQDDPFFDCYSVVDERSALYFAIGIYLSTGKPVAVCCTSAQATRNYLPGLTEAYYKHVPILAITFSKHPRFTYQEYMQAPDQTSLPKDSVKKSFSLPYVSDDNDRLYCERLVNEGILELNYHNQGPVQVNVPMLDSELSLFTENSLPTVKIIKRVNLNVANSINIGKKKVLIVVGENRGIDDTAIKNFARKANAVIYVNHLSNMKNEYTVQGNLLLTCISQKMFDEVFCPDILITIGGQTGDYPLYHRLAESKINYEHWRVSEDGELKDTYDHLTRIYQSNPSVFFEKAVLDSEFGEYCNIWKTALDNLDTNIDLPLSNAFIAQQLSSRIPCNAMVHFSILNTLRIWDLFQFSNPVRCFCNVAAFGIDGCMSTFIGSSTVTDELCYLIIGDLSFFYDMNSLGIRHISSNIRIVLINNNGGVEFKLGGTAEKNIKTNRFIAAAGHFKSAEGWALTNGFDYFVIRDKESFNVQKEILMARSSKPILFEVFTTDLDDAMAYRIIKKHNDKRPFLDKAIKRLKNVIRKRL